MDFDTGRHRESGWQGPYNEASGFLDEKARAQERIKRHLDAATVALIGPTALSNTPPRESGTSTLLSFFMSKEQCHCFIGDLEERYAVILEQEGRRAATIWFWRQVVLSVFSLSLDAVKRISGLEKFIERCHRIGS
jgi:hypothetical protein